MEVAKSGFFNQLHFSDKDNRIGRNFNNVVYYLEQNLCLYISNEEKNFIKKSQTVNRRLSSIQTIIDDSLLKVHVH
ncbi:CLUMA_CG008614, isoform A [Clunio marinus]|uniref:CLUMA_CG008614, isoform A n=1 Tax=Clunio marinus TaxID=568069 RepID=A0A1J1I4A5_9DIPT|nr:CLUMA_CG008614, isoform A [Clunio marinus]